jgi:aminopeptidase N
MGAVMSRRMPILAVTTMLLVGLGTVPAGAADGGPEGSPGAPGIGDPYFPLDGNGGYDVQHYDLDVRYDPATDVLTGVATIEAQAVQDLSRFDLDFVGLEIRSLTVDGDAAAWSRDGQELTITPEDVLPDGATFTTVVSYDGVPQTIVDPLLGLSGFIPTDDGAIVAGQPDAAATWFPANDHPRDAASVSVTASVPEGLEAISNGVLEGEETSAGWTTWSWRAEEPMATYLVTLAIGEFDVRERQAGGIRYWDALDPDLFQQPPGVPADSTFGTLADGALARQPEIIDFLAANFGPYPFGASGGIVDDYPALGFALETQTRPIYSMAFFTDPVGSDLVVVHELAHQWTGDLLRVDRWQHLWLNEGFASYMEWLWLDRTGVITLPEIYNLLTGIPAADPFWDVMTGNPGPADLFDVEAVYLRGALTLHALRLELGDEVFFGLLTKWVASQAGSTVTSDEFIALAEQESGRQLDDFFEAWLFTAAKPPGLPDAPPEAPAAARAVGDLLPGSTLGR